MIILPKKKQKEEKTKVSFSKKIIVTMFDTMILFTISMIVTFWKKDMVPDELIIQFFAFFGLEGGALGIIKVAESWADKFDLSAIKKKNSKDKGDK